MSKPHAHTKTYTRTAYYYIQEEVTNSLFVFVISS